MTYDLIPTVAFALTTALAVWRWQHWKGEVAKWKALANNETRLLTQCEARLKAARERTDLAVKAAPKRTAKKAR